MQSINTRPDLDALIGTPEHEAFMQALSGTIYRLEKDDAAKAWVAVQDTRTIERFGFTLADFAGVSSPVLPEYVTPSIAAPAAITMRQARLALLGAGLLAQVNAAIAAMPGAAGEAARIEWEYAQEVRRDSPLLAALAPALGMSSAQVDDLFVAAAGL
nr:hypothetical protein [uncultured Rhodoferax sp.]